MRKHGRKSGEMYDILIQDARVNPRTGYVEVDVVAVNGDDKGPMHTYGCCPQEIKARYGGSVETWLQYVKTQHQEHAGFHDGVVDKLLQLKGTKL